MLFFLCLLCNITVRHQQLPCKLGAQTIPSTAAPFLCRAFTDLVALCAYTRVHVHTHTRDTQTNGTRVGKAGALSAGLCQAAGGADPPLRLLPPGIYCLPVQGEGCSLGNPLTHTCFVKMKCCRLIVIMGNFFWKELDTPAGAASVLSRTGACVLGLEGFLAQKSVLPEPSARCLSARDQVCRLRL